MSAVPSSNESLSQSFLVTYECDLNLDDHYHFHTRLYEYFSRDALEAWRFVMRFTVKTPALESALSAAERVISLADGKSEPQGLIITGDVGTGKSSVLNVLRHICRSKNLLHVNDNSLLVETQLRHRSTRYCLIRNLLEVLEHPLVNTEHKKATADIKFKILSHTLKTANSLALVIDEAQNLFTAVRSKHSSMSGGNEITDMLRALMDQAKIPIILVGTKPLQDLSSLDPGLASRIRTTVVMPALDEKTWQLMLNAYYQVIKKYCDPSILRESSAQLEIQNFVKGEQRQLKRLMAELALLAVENKHSKLTTEVLKAALHNLREEGI